MKVLVVAPHMDDEVLGVGGTIKKRSLNGDIVTVCIATEGRPPYYSSEFTEKEKDECRKAHEILGVRKTDFLGIPTITAEDIPLRNLYLRVLGEVERTCPDEIYIPFANDMHIEHRTIADACMYACRPTKGKIARIYAYEVMSETGWNADCISGGFMPNVFEDITETMKYKIEALEAYKSQEQIKPKARSVYAIDSLAGYRGTLVCKEKCEAFMLVREIK